MSHSVFLFFRTRIALELVVRVAEGEVVTRFPEAHGAVSFGNAQCSATGRGCASAHAWPICSGMWADLKFSYVFAFWRPARHTTYTPHSHRSLYASLKRLGPLHDYNVHVARWSRCSAALLFRSSRFCFRGSLRYPLDTLVASARAGSTGRVGGIALVARPSTQAVRQVELYARGSWE